MEEPASRRLDADDDDASHLAHPQAGIALVYFPFTANDKVEGVDPLKSDFMSTWNFVYTPEQIGQVVQLARANFKEGEAQTKRTIEAVWRRKRDARLQREREQLEYQRRLRLRRGRAALFRNGDVGQGDQFSGI
jgi:phospholipase A2